MIRDSRPKDGATQGPLIGAERDVMDAGFARWLDRYRGLAPLQTRVARAAWITAWAACREYLISQEGPVFEPTPREPRDLLEQPD
jgi:hypothetical protein